MFTKNPAHPPVILGDHFNHFNAPVDYAAQSGGEWTSSPLLCPICDCSTVRFDLSEPLSISRQVGGTVTLPMDGSTATQKNGDEEALWVTIPMHCTNGHRWSLDLDQRNGEDLRFCVLLSHADYAPHITVASELSDYDDENSVTDRSQSKILNGKKAVA